MAKTDLADIEITLIESKFFTKAQTGQEDGFRRKKPG